MTELGWSVSDVTQEHLQNLINQGYMTSTELATCRVPEDLVFPGPAGGYIVVCAAFYKRGFGVPSHQFLHSLQQFYNLELHHLTPLGILHVAASVTLFEAYIGIEPHFNPCNYFFRAWLRQGSDMETVALGNVDIFVRFRPKVDPYFSVLMPGPLVGWRRAWFLLRDDADAPLKQTSKGYSTYGRLFGDCCKGD
jgi:hypothetical protein